MIWDKAIRASYSAIYMSTTRPFVVGLRLLQILWAEAMGENFFEGMHPVVIGCFSDNYGHVVGCEFF